MVVGEVIPTRRERGESDVLMRAVVNTPCRARLAESYEKAKPRIIKAPILRACTRIIMAMLGRISIVYRPEHLWE